MVVKQKNIEKFKNIDVKWILTSFHKLIGKYTEYRLASASNTCLCIGTCTIQSYTIMRNVNMDLGVFSAPEPKAQVHYCDHALSVVRRPSVRR